MGLFNRTKKQLTLVEQASKADEVLSALGIPKHTESGRQIREAVALELLSSEYDSIQGYKAGAFINQMGTETIQQIKELLSQQGVLTRKRLPNKTLPIKK